MKIAVIDRNMNVYSANQIKCLQALGVTPVELITPSREQPSSVSQSKESERISPFLNWELAPEKLIADLSKIFPQIRVKGEELILKPGLVWRSSTSQTSVSFDNGVLLTPSYNELSKELKMNIWQIIKTL